MRVETRTNLVWDDADPRCKIITSHSQGHTFAFVQVIDNGKHIKRYWGVWNPNDPEVSMLDIMTHGGKWPDLEAAQ